MKKIINIQLDADKRTTVVDDLMLMRFWIIFNLNGWNDLIGKVVEDKMSEITPCS